MIMSKPSNPKIKTSANKKQTISTTKKKAPAKKTSLAKNKTKKVTQKKIQNIKTIISKNKSNTINKLNTFKLKSKKDSSKLNSSKKIETSKNQPDLNIIPKPIQNGFFGKFAAQLDKNVSYLTKGLPNVKKKEILKPATIFSRIAAFVTDFIIIDIIIFSWFKKYIFALLPENNMSILEQLTYVQSNPTQSEQLVIVSFILLGLTYAYFAFFEYKFGQTLGKMLFRLKVISAKPLINQMQKYKTDMSKITKKIIESDKETIDIHQEMRKDIPQNKQNITPNSFSLSIWQALGRSLYFIPFAPLMAIAFVDLFYLIFKKRRLTEIYTKTTVVEIIPLHRLEKLNSLLQRYFKNKN